SHISIFGGTLDNFKVNATNDKIYTATFTPTREGAASIDIKEHAFQNAAGNYNNDKNEIIFTIDTISPVITIESIDNKDTLRTNQTARIYFTLSENSDNFTIDKITLNGSGTLSAFSALGNSKKDYFVTLTPEENSTENITISVANNAFQDTLGNNNEDGSESNNKITFTVDTLRPTATLITTEITTTNIKVKSSETGFAYLVHDNLNGLTVDTQRELNILATGHNANKIAIHANTEANISTAGLFNGNYILYTTDAIGNVSTATTNTITIDNPLLIDGNGSTDLITFYFANAVEDFTEDDIQIKNGTLIPNTLTKEKDSNNWTIKVTQNPNTSTHENIAITIAANAFKINGIPNTQVFKNITSLASLSDKVTIATFDFENFDTSHAMTATKAFQEATLFNTNISHWNTAIITDMSYMFDGAESFNQYINTNGNAWNTAAVIDMSGMFRNAKVFNENINTWNTAVVTKMSFMFAGATVFNQNINTWNTAAVQNMEGMFAGTEAFNQNIGGWDISSLTSALFMFQNSGISLINMDKTILGWAKLDTSSGETAIQNSVEWTVANYTDATARQYLIDTYHWTINDSFNNTNTIKGTNNAETLRITTTKTTAHGLGGNDTITGSTSTDTLVGGAGDDTLTGGLGLDTFKYAFKNAGKDTITDFNTAEGDKIDLADLLIGYESSKITDFVTAQASGSGTIITVDYNGTVASAELVEITLENITYNDTLLNTLIANNNLILA
ncbi:MAG: BspA family leucine-rich repeat surface protein, partial [Gammaproteobacteria bacterium]|nr:BspA family leucine-rich repeat surface protein [Gammaproteobacteria bacterium]